MLKSKSAILIAVGVLLSIAIGLQFIKKQEKEIANTIKAIPSDAALILETDDFPLLIQKLNNSNVFKNEFSSVAQWGNFFSKIGFLDSLFNTKREIKNAFTGNELVCSGHLSAKNTMDFLFVLSVKDENYKSKIRNYIAELVSERAAIMQRTYEGFNVYDLAFFDEADRNISFSYTFTDGLFIFSFSKILTEEAIRRLISGSSLISDKGFNKLSQTAGKNVDANIFINYKYFPNNLKNVINPQNSTFFQFVDHFASWTVLDLKLKSDAILMSGFTYSDDSLSSYLNVFKGQDNIGNDFLTILPENSSAFLTINLKDINSFKLKYSNYLKKNRKYRKVKLRIDELSKDYKSDLSNIFYENIEGAVSIAYIQSRTLKEDQQVLGFFQLKDEEKFAFTMEELSKKQASPDSIIIGQAQTTTIDTKNNISIKKFPFPQLFPLLFGKVFNPLDAQFYMIVDDYLVIGKSVKILKLYYKKYQQELILAKSKDFVAFSNSLSSESNIFLYANFYHSKPLIKSEITKGLGKIYNKNIDKFDKLQAVALQFGLEKDLFFTNFYLNYNTAFRKKTKSAWELQLDTLVNMKPHIVLNHYTGNREVLVQDEANNLILFGTDGKLLWKRHLPEKILGQVHQIDFYKNNKLQLLFNTRGYIFMIDRNGKDVENYPIKFKSPATNGLSVMDYSGNRNYRILVACENKNVYLLNKNAGKVDGWKFEKTTGIVKSQIQYFSNDGKDYLVFADDLRVYILNRRGETRIELKSQFAKAANSKFFFEKGTSKGNARFVTTSKAGTVYFIYLDGTLKKMTLDKFSTNHHFRYDDLFGSGKKYFVFTDDSRLVVYNGDKSVRFDEKFGGPINNTLNLYKIDKNIKFIGISVNVENKIYLITPNGKMVKGFPMVGAAPFSISQLNKKGKDLNLLVGSSDNFLYNYSIHMNQP
ncbi:MAG: hypothetical protein ABFS35_19175 [Bacteroidota bacterium]